MYISICHTILYNYYIIPVMLLPKVWFIGLLLEILFHCVKSIIGNGNDLLYVLIIKVLKLQIQKIA